MRWTITEKDNGRNFLGTKSVIDFFLIDKRYIFMHTAKIGPWQIFQLSIFVLSREKCHYPGQVSYFRFYFCISFTSASRKFWATLSVWNTNCLLAAKRQATLDWERPTLCHSYSNLKQLIDDIKLIFKKSYRNIVRVLLRFLSGREIHLKHRSLYNIFFP